MRRTIEESLSRLRAYCERENFEGWDPFDGLNSNVFRSLGLNRSRVLRLAWLQLLKQFPLNLRRLLGCAKGSNSKALALFLSSYCSILRRTGDKALLPVIRSLTNRLKTARISGYSGDCWGYDFDWQARAFFQPAGTPMVVATSFAGGAMLDAYRILLDESLLRSARSACDFVLQDLNRTETDAGLCFSYSPIDHTQVFNASLLAARLLSRVYSHVREEKLVAAAESAVRFACTWQRPDGAWPYSPLPYHSWVDSFHTGFNLESLAEYRSCSGDTRWDGTIERGLAYYRSRFFRNDGLPKYYDNRSFPVEVHAPAQFAVTMTRLGLPSDSRTEVERTLEWTIRKMQDVGGWFYYRKWKYWTIRIPYMRWSQAWMMYAMAIYLEGAE
jgi:hypothetical protein